MERALWSVGGDGEVHDEDAGILCEIDEFRVGTVLIRTEHNRDAPRLDAVGERRQVGVRDAHCSHADSIAIEHRRWLGLGPSLYSLIAHAYGRGWPAGHETFLCSSEFELGAE